jgi:IS30 family transposase
VDYRLTKRWRAACRPVPPEPEPPTISPRFLSQDERLLIADRLRDKASLRSIARQLGRPVSTISRETHRNRQPDGTYQPYRAHAMAPARRGRPKTGTLATDPALRAIVQDGLDQRWSPQQITRRLRRDHPDRPEWHVTHETLYQALYVQAKVGYAGRSPPGCVPAARNAARSANPTSANRGWPPTW